MQTISLENADLKIEVSSNGAELHSLIQKDIGLEHIWQADKNIWPWHAPNLFPVVGSCKNDQILVNEIAYPMNRHGFARNSIFTLLDSNPVHAIFTLSTSEASLVHYPFNFEFQIIYDLIGKKLRISYKVINKDIGDIYFSVGAHPAFKVPFFKDENYEDYYIEFADPAPSKIYLLNKR